MKNTEDIFELLGKKINPKKIIQLTHCLQTPSNEMLPFNFTLNKNFKYIYLGKHGKLDKILRIEPNNDTQFFLGHWNDGVTES